MTRIVFWGMPQVARQLTAFGISSEETSVNRETREKCERTKKTGVAWH
jgi:hypothetical protein